MTRFNTRVVHAGLDPDPSFGGVVPPIHQASTYVQKAPGEFVGDYDYSRSANPTRTQLEKALGELEGGRGTAFSSGMAATHALITAGAECPSSIFMRRAFSAKQNHTNGSVFLRIIEGIVKFSRCLGPKSISHLRTIESDPGYAIAFFVSDIFVNFSSNPLHDFRFG